MDIKPTFSNLHTAPTAICTLTNPPNALGLLISAAPFTRLPLPQLAANDFPNLQHSWFEDIYKRRRKAGKNGNDEDNPGNPKGSILSSYMEDNNGVEIPEQERDNARKTAKGFFSLLLQTNRAPPCWRDLAIDAENEYLHIMESSHSFLRLCDNHWKAKRIATNSYSQWLGGAIKRLAAAKAKNASAGEIIDIDSDDDVDTSSKRPQAEDNDVRHSKRPRVEATEPAPRPRPTRITRHRQRVCDPLYLDYMRR